MNHDQIINEKVETDYFVTPKFIYFIKRVVLVSFRGFPEANRTRDKVGPLHIPPFVTKRWAHNSPPALNTFFSG